MKILGGPAAAVLLLLPPQPPQPARPYRPPVDVELWNTLDLEARWVLFKKSKAPGAHWAQFLAERKEEELLEWIVISDTWSDFGPRLAAMDSPRWIRATCWNSENPDSHSLESAEKTLLLRSPLVLDWLDKNPKALRGKLQKLRAGLEKQARGKREDSARYLPALDPAAVLRHLDAPARVVEFGERPRAQPRRVYLHQVERAIQAMLNGGFFAARWRRKLLALTSHPVPAVRRAAYLAFSRVPAQFIPHGVFLDRARRVQHAPERGWALLAFSYAGHPRVFSVLHEYARQPENAAWQSAVSRLGDIGNGFTVAWLAALKEAELGEPARDLLARQLTRIRARIKATKPMTVARQLRDLLERAAWAGARDLELADQLVAWTRERIRSVATAAEVRRQLRILAAAYVTPRHLGDAEFRARFRQLVRGYASELLAK